MRPIPSIDEMPHLKARLGKAGSDKVRCAHRASSLPPLRGTNLPNTVRDRLQDGAPPRVMDILNGAANLSENYERGLSPSRMVSLLQCLSHINTREVRKMMAVSDRVARLYVNALVFALPFIEKELEVAA